MLSPYTQVVLIEEPLTPYALDSIYNYQAAGETVEWHYADVSYYTPYDYYIDVFNIVTAIDSVIDLDFTYTHNYQQADYLVYAYDTRYDGILGSHTDNIYWGLTEIFYDPYSSYQSNLNTFVHELGHYLGLGEPGYDWRLDQSDTAMSYNPDFANVAGGWQNFFTENDLAVLIALHGAENDFLAPVGALTGTSSGDRIFGTDGDDVIYGLGGNDELYGESGDDIIDGGSGKNDLHGGNGYDIFVWSSDSKNTIYDFQVSKDFLGGFSSSVKIKNKGDDIKIKDSGSKFILLDTNYDKFMNYIDDDLIFIDDFLA